MNGILVHNFVLVPYQMTNNYMNKSVCLGLGGNTVYTVLWGDPYSTELLGLYLS